MHKNEQYLSGNCSNNFTGCDIISKSEMYMFFFYKLSSSRQIQNNLMKKCVFTDLNIRKG